MKIKLSIIILTFCLKCYSFTYFCTTEDKTKDGENTFYLLKYDGKYDCMVIRTNKLKDKYDPWGQDHDYPEFDPEYDPTHKENLELIVEDTESTLLLVTPFVDRAYRVTILDKEEKIWMCTILSPNGESIKEILKEYDFFDTRLKTIGTFEIIEDASDKNEKVK